MPWVCVPYTPVFGGHWLGNTYQEQNKKRTWEKETTEQPMRRWREVWSYLSPSWGTPRTRFLKISQHELWLRVNYVYKSLLRNQGHARLMYKFGSRGWHYKCAALCSQTAGKNIPQFWFLSCIIYNGAGKRLLAVDDYKHKRLHTT